MAEFPDLQRFFDRVREECQNRLPDALGQVMYEETQENFNRQEYGNDDLQEKWRNRTYEQYLNYPKLNYTGRLKRSFSWSKISKSKHGVTIKFGSSSSYAKIQQEGLQGGGNSRRRPPYSDIPLTLPTKPYPRQFMGFGRRSIRRFQQAIDRKMREIFG